MIPMITPIGRLRARNQRASGSAIRIGVITRIFDLTRYADYDRLDDDVRLFCHDR
jgi:hypothetical protein